MLSQARQMHMAYKVMIVDDDLDDIFIMRRALSRIQYFITHSADISLAHDGEMALQQLRQSVVSKTLPDIMLLDLNMSGLDGFDVLRSCREDPDLKGLLIVVLTTASDAETHRKAMELGADAVYAKPESGEKMAKLLDEVIPHTLLD